MRTFVLTLAAASIATLPLAAAVKAEETTVIHKDNGYGDHKTVIKKHENTPFGSRVEKKVIIHHDY
jgi:hypothetical protein